VLPQPFALSTPDVYREADRLGLGRMADELAGLRARVAELLPPDGAAGVPGALPVELCVNDLQAAALSLAPELAGVLGAAREAGADHAIVCGSGPTVIGLFLGREAGARARAAAADGALRERFPRAVVASPVHSAQSRSPV
jgi:4-diphosphocytidyl-2-C-methyl-D-erythritol kinase